MRRPAICAPRRPAWKLLCLALLTASLGACTVGPDYVRPDAPAPQGFARASELPVTAGSAISPSANFWRHLGDPALATLVEEALLSNGDLRVALANWDRARALLRETRYDYGPTATAAATGMQTRAAEGAAPGGGGDSTRNFTGQLGAQWEIDLFGRVRRAVEAQEAEAWATASDLAGLQVAVVGEVARTYIELRGLQDRLRVARANAQLQRETLRLVEASNAAGRGTAFDTSRARSQLEATLSRIPAFEASEAVAMHRLAVLTGRTPDALVTRLSTSAAVPRIDVHLDGDTPASLLRRRPDVVEAEHRLHAATARVGVSTADLFPRLTLSGLLGAQASSAGALVSGGSGTGLVAFGIDWSFLDVGRVRARIQAAEADAGGALAQYQQTVLVALEETENALVRHSRAFREAEHLRTSAENGANASRLARIRYEAGASGLLEVLDVERTQLQTEDALADAEARSALTAVTVYTALAGGWREFTPTTATARAP
jgi:multidrug efflux system outer membrane protein